MNKKQEYTGPKTIRLIEDTEGELIKIQIPEGLVESGIKAEECEVEHYTRVPLEEEDYNRLKEIADKHNITVDDLASHLTRKRLEEEEKTAAKH